MTDKEIKKQAKKEFPMPDKGCCPEKRRAIIRLREQYFNMMKKKQDADGR